MSVRDGIEHLKAGRFEDAAAIFQPLAEKNDAASIHLLALVRHAQGDVDRAIALVRRAIALSPKAAVFHSALGIMLAEQDSKASLEAHARAAELSPTDAEMQHNLGLALVRDGKIAEGMDAYRQAIKLAPTLAPAHSSLGHAMLRSGLEAEALGEFTLAITFDAGCVEAHYGVAVILTMHQEFDEALKHVRKALEKNPRHVPSLVLASKVYCARGNAADAEKLALAALKQSPGDAVAHAALGEAYAAMSKPEQARQAFREAAKHDPDRGAGILGEGLRLRALSGSPGVREDIERELAAAPDEPELLWALATANFVEGRTKEAIDVARKLVEIDPNRLAPRSMIVGLSHYEETSDRVLFDQAIEWGARARAKTTRMPPPDIDLDPDRKLRVGYVSGDFRSHPVGYTLAPVLPHHAKTQIEVFLYSNQTREDDFTNTFRRSGHHWRQVVGLSNERLARLVRDDAIDILVDLSGHTDANRLEMFVRKPAPIQVTWLGYYATTGVAEIDWILCDEYVLPPEEEQWYIERPWRLPGCYAPLPKINIPLFVNPLPCLKTGFVTFGCFNNLRKVTEKVVETWSRILQRVEGSRLALQTQLLNTPEGRRAMWDRFAEYGIDESRVLLSPHAPQWNALRNYGHIDIALDPFPYNGGATTMQALYMGVPVITKSGTSFVSNVGRSLLSSMGMSDFVAKDEDEYVEIAVRLVKDRDALSTKRALLREVVDRAANPKVFALKLDNAFRGMWHDYIERQ